MNKRIISVAMFMAMAALASLVWYFLPRQADAASAPDQTAAHSTEDSPGIPAQGADGRYVTDGGRTYYLDADGIPQKGGIVGSERDGYTLADENGVCCTSEEIRMAADFMMKYCEGETLDEKMKAGYQYLSKHVPYVRSYEHDYTAQDMGALAVDMFTNLKGNCYRYAACFACIARIAGYRTRVVMGSTVGNPHGWTEVLVGGKWLICDPDTQMAEQLLPDYAAYMMKKHIWQVKADKRYELTISEDGAAVWIDVTP